MAPERLTAQQTAETSPVAAAHVQRYEWAAGLLRDARVLDLCCGDGHGSRILAGAAASVHGVDISAEAVETARRAVAGGAPATFEQADPLEFLRRPRAESFDAIVFFEGIEPLPDLPVVIEELAGVAGDGTRIVLSVANRRTFGEEEGFEFDSVRALASRLPQSALLFQHVAEGALVLPGTPLDDEAVTARLRLGHHAEPEYANHYLITSNIPTDVAERAAAAAPLALTAAPVHSRLIRTLERANRELWHHNARLGRQLADIAEGATPDAGRRLGISSGAAALAGRDHLRTEVQRLAEELAEARALLEAARRERDQIRGELMEVGADRGRAWHRYNELRGRKAVRVALGLARILGR